MTMLKSDASSSGEEGYYYSYYFERDENMIQIDMI